MTAAWTEPQLPYGFVIEGSTNATQWTTLADHTQSANTNPSVSAVTGSPRYLRVRTTTVESGQWASIREVGLTGADGRPIANGIIPAGESPSVESYPDASWRKLDLPHDWGIEGPFRLELPGATGKLPWRGIGWYRKHFTVPVADAGKRVFIDFDGAMCYAKIWCNGQYVGTWPYGYSSFRMDLTPFLNFGGENIIAVRLDTETWDSRWYPGAGIYRHVWLVKTEAVHVAHWGTYITTPTVTDSSANVNLEVTVDNTTAAPVQAAVITEFFELDANGIPIGEAVVQSAPANVEIPATGKAVVQQPTSISQPKCWGIASPNRYLARTRVSLGGNVVDIYDTPFGIRTIEFTARNGFLLNGRRVPIQGVCNHHDLGALGTAINTRALERQLEIMKEMGCNAIRTSHNPPAPELLELADRMGILIMDEAFDAWRTPKKPNDYNKIFEEWHKRDLEALVRRDRNHPSVFIWSIGNEVPDQQNVALTAQLAGIVRNLDPTRPISNGYNDPDGGRESGAAMALDVMGVNYFFSQQDRWDADPRYQSMPTMGSETASSLSSRGEYFFGTHQANWQVSSYDLFAAIWGSNPDGQFRTNARWPHLLGEFIWTGFDYLGEPVPYMTEDETLLLNSRSDPEQSAGLEAELAALALTRPPSRGSYFGAVDQAGFPKDRYYLYQSQWRPELPMAHILPHWNWPERAGQTTPVHLYTSGDEAELFLNGRSLGRKVKTPGQDFRLVWEEVIYEPGNLQAVAYKNGNQWAIATVKTTGPATAVTLAADRPTIQKDGRDLAFVTVRIVDQDGLTVPRTVNPLDFTVSGPGEIVAVDNGDPTSLEPFRASRIKAYNGLALVIVRAKPGETGDITLSATSEGLKAASVLIGTQYRATDRIWNNGAATGNWNSTDLNWTGETWNNAAPDRAFFGVTGIGTVTLTEPVTVGNLTFNNEGFTIAGNTLTLSNTSIDSIAGATISSVLAGSSGMVKTGAGTLSLAAVNTYTGGTTVNDGVLELSGATGGPGIIRGTATVNAGAELRCTGGDGTGLGWGADRVTTLNINGGMVNSPSPNDTHLWFATLNMTGGELRVNGGVGDPNGPAIQWTSNVSTSSNASTAVISGRVNLRGHGGSFANAVFDVADGAAATDLLVSAAVTNSSPYDWPVGITKTGAGTMTLSAANSHHGETIVSQGTLLINGDNSAATGAVTVASGATLGGTGTVGGALSVTGVVNPGNPGAIGTLGVATTGITGTFVCDIDAATSDTLAVAGDLDLTGSSLSLNQLAAPAAASCTVATYSGNLIGNFGSPPAGLPGADDDGDGWSNFQEYAFGLDPKSGASVNPITVPLNKTTGKFSYTRRKLSLPFPPLAYTVWYSTDLSVWEKDAGASEGTPVPAGEVETVEVSVSPALLTNPKLFIQIHAE